MSKTPEQMAEEYAEFGTQGVPDSIRKQQLMAKDKMTFLAGYQAAQPQWISVKDRLPPPQTEVLWWNRTAHQAGVSSWEYMSDCNDTMIYWGDAGNLSIKNFTHWMPLPCAPKEEA